MKGLLSIAALLTATASALPAASPAEALQQLKGRSITCTMFATDNLIFRVSMDTFQKARNEKNPSKCDWSSDNCSRSPDKPIRFDFVPSCQRHDFGYRNIKAQKRFTRLMKSDIDRNFKKDLYTYCSQFKGVWAFQAIECRRIADVYYGAVRGFGKRDEMEFDDDVEGQVEGRDIEEDLFEKREDSVLDIELDDDIEDQEIPPVLENDGPDVDDIESIVS